MEEMKQMINFGESEEKRSLTEDSPKLSRVQKQSIAATEVNRKRKRRKFTKEFKLKILKEVDECSQPGQIGAILRREGIYSSYITTWRRQLDLGKLTSGKKNTYQRKIFQLSEENRKLRRELKRAKTIISTQKKISELLELNEES